MVLYAAGKIAGPQLSALETSRNCSISKSLPPRCALAPAAPTPICVNIPSSPKNSHYWRGPLRGPVESPIRTAEHWEATLPTASPAGDSLPVLLVYDADLILVSVRGERRIPYRTFHTGYKRTLLASDELIHSIQHQQKSQRLHVLHKESGSAQRTGNLEGSLSRPWHASQIQRSKMCGLQPAVWDQFQFDWPQRTRVGRPA